ncbi:MAG: UbiH/UbiF/VisC/COQ6 family ubiquinone biosynthesis hydroxylase [Micavibrio sp.]
MTARKTASPPPRKMDADVIVVGGGAAGCTMAGLLAKHGVSVICLDADDPQKAMRADFDGRTMAISFGSRRVIEEAGAWDALEAAACPIEDIKITENGSDTLLEFLAQDVDEEAFGWIVEFRNLRKSLFETLARQKNARHIAPARVSGYELHGDAACAVLEDGTKLHARLVIGADGKNSMTREWMGIGTRGKSYRQRGIVCIVRHENPHNNIAVEDFRGDGPFAILPMTDDEQGNHRSSIVWTEHEGTQKSITLWDENSFNAALNERFPSFYGAVQCAGPRFSYPLGLKHAYAYTGPRMALIADAAHAIHPIAGQGLNLGLRDVAELAQLIIRAHKNGGDAGSHDLLEAYERARRTDNMVMAGATDTLNALFSNNRRGIGFLRRAGLRAVQRFHPARQFFMRQAMGASGLLPDLIKTGRIL